MIGEAVIDLGDGRTRRENIQHFGLSGPMKFFHSVSKPEGTSCWLWTGFLNQAGYGTLHLGDDEKVYAHRYSYEIAYGQIPDDLTVDHLCFTPACVNPVHLRLLTNRENARNQRHPTHCPQGHAYTPENRSRTKSGHLHCKTCNRERMRAYSARKRAEAAAIADTA